MLPVRKRKIGVCILLSIITLGIYAIYWQYLLVKNVRATQRDRFSCVGEMSCLIFIPFYSVYWWYTRGKTVKKEFEEHGFSASGNEIAYLILSVFGLGIVSMAIMQHDFNSLPFEQEKSTRKGRAAVDADWVKPKMGLKRYIKRYTKRNLFLFSLLFIPMLHFLIFWVYVNIRTISLAFMKWDTFENVYRFVGLDNFKSEIKTYLAAPEHLNLYFNSFRAIPINIACLVLAIIIGYAFSKHIRGERVFRIIFYLPSMISIVILTLCFRYMFTYNANMWEGPAATLLRTIGVNWEGWEVTTKDPAVINRIWLLVSIFCVWASAGINIILMSSAMSRIPEEVIESAKLDGVGFWRELFQIHIPLIMPTISVFLVNSVMAVSAFYIQPMLILKEADSTFKTVGWFMFQQTQSAQNGDLPTVSTVGFFMTVAVSALIIIVRKITDKITPDVDF